MGLQCSGKQRDAVHSAQAVITSPLSKLSGNIYIVHVGLDYAPRIECSLHKEHGWSRSVRMHSETSIKGNTIL